jgi:hypothetical protein
MTGLLLCLPAAVLLASVSLAMMVGKLRRQPPRGMNRRCPDLPRAEHEELRDDASFLSSAPAGRFG